MCMKTPDMKAPPAPPKVEQIDASDQKASSRAAEIRRRRAALSRADTMQGGTGAMSSGGAGTSKKKLGE
ncbi:hypothetical protein FACS1894187_05030 [Synergistales bacterium]|nr:hypothetical protein FACS1894187_05030 [Synergistales bacterium]